MNDPGRRDVGSDFELADPSIISNEPAHQPPWDEPGWTPLYVESGRQALALVERSLRLQGRNRLSMPAHFCESMVEPFLRHGWTVCTVPVLSDLQISPEALAGHSVDDRDVVLHAPYFGAVDSSETLTALDRLEAAGAAIVVDETHSFLTPTSHRGRMRVASLRKLLPLPDGAFVIGLSELRIEAGTEVRASDLRHDAMVAKTGFLAGDRPQSDEHLELFARAEQLTELHTEPASMSRRSADLVGRLNYKLIAERRVRNAKALLDALTGSSRYSVVAPAMPAVPSHLVIVGPDIVGLRRALIRERVFCPIHWPAPEHLGPKLVSAWRADVLSVPIDQRYVPADMLRVAEGIKAYRPQDEATHSR